MSCRSVTATVARSLAEHLCFSITWCVCVYKWHLFRHTEFKPISHAVEHLNKKAEREFSINESMVWKCLIPRCTLWSEKYGPQLNFKS